MKASLANVEGRSPEQQAGLIACSSAPPWTKSVKDLVDGIESDVSRDANGARTYHCRWPGCKVTTGDSSHIKRHVKTGHLRDMQDYVCPVPFCGRAGNRLDNLKSHYKRLHIDYVVCHLTSSCPRLTLY